MAASVRSALAARCWRQSLGAAVRSKAYLAEPAVAGCRSFHHAPQRVWCAFGPGVARTNAAAPPQPGPGRRGAAGTAAGTSAADAEFLVASVDSKAASLGGAVASRVRRTQSATVRSIGAKAAYNAIKAMVNADEYLRQDAGAQEGQRLALTLWEGAVAQTGDTGEEAKRTVMFIKASPVAAVPAGPVRDLVVGARTNAGKAAAAVAGAMRPIGEGRAAMRAMGAEAIHKAMVAGAMAQKYLDNDDRGVRFAVVPDFEEVEVEPGRRKLKQLVLNVFRTSKPKE